VEPPTEKEVNHAITGNMRELLVVIRAVRRFKSLLWKKRPDLFKSMLGSNVRIVQPPDPIGKSHDMGLQKSRSFDLDDRRAIEGALVVEGVHREPNSPTFNDTKPVIDRFDSVVMISDADREKSQEHSQSPRKHVGHRHITGDEVPELHSVALNLQDATTRGEKGHAHDPMGETPLYLGVGGGLEVEADGEEIAESPTAAEFNIYDTAYANEVARIREAQGTKATVYLTRRVDHKREFKADEHMLGLRASPGGAREGFRALVEEAKGKKAEVQAMAKEERDKREAEGQGGRSLSELVDEAETEGRRVLGNLGDKGSSILAGVVGKVQEMKKARS
jgi:[calcium/calmodulin-dependent protein kinase] kinase